jgi:hypothetical protein
MSGTWQMAAHYGDFALGVRMSSSKYHRKQAEILAGLALSTGDAKKADQFKLAAMEQFERAQTVQDAEVSPSHATDSQTKVNLQHSI